MSAQHRELFHELYTQKYIEQRPEYNPIQRIQMLQKQMKEEKVLKRHQEPSLIAIEHLPNLENLESIHEDAPKRVVRALLAKRKKMPSKLN